MHGLEGGGSGSWLVRPMDRACRLDLRGQSSRAQFWEKRWRPDHLESGMPEMTGCRRGPSVGPLSICLAASGAGVARPGAGSVVHRGVAGGLRVYSVSNTVVATGLAAASAHRLGDSGRAERG